MKTKTSAVISLCILLAVGLGCNDVIKKFEQGDSKPSANSNKSEDRKTDAPPEGKSVPKPAEGKANVWGQVFFDSKPVAKIDVRLCEKLNSFTMDCSGKEYSALTDDSGEYLIADVDPLEYEGLIVKVFTTNFYLYETAGYGNLPKHYTLSAGQTLFMNSTDLFKNDLKVTGPKEKSSMTADAVNITWVAYPNASHYTLSLLPQSSGDAAQIYDVKVEETSYKPQEALKPGEYTIILNAYNKDEKKIAQTNDYVHFTVK